PAASEKKTQKPLGAEAEAAKPQGVATRRDEAAFWSGRSGANRKAAEESTLTTLEKTAGGRALEAQDLFTKMDYTDAIIPWEDLSREYATKASGTVTAWVGGAS